MHVVPLIFHPEFFVRARRIDANHRAVRDGIREALPDAVVVDLSGAGDGVPDLLVGHGGRNYLLEVKDPGQPPSRRRLTRAQQAWHSRWTGQVDVVHTVEEALGALVDIAP